jgi:hypothetical protein
MPCSGIINIAHSEGGVAPDTMGKKEKEKEVPFTLGNARKFEKNIS